MRRDHAIFRYNVLDKFAGQQRQHFILIGIACYPPTFIFREVKFYIEPTFQPCKFLFQTGIERFNVTL